MQAHILTKCWRVGWAQAYLEAGRSCQQDFVLGPLMISSYSQASPHLRHSCRTSFSSSWPWQQVQPAVPALGDLFHIESSTSGKTMVRLRACPKKEHSRGRGGLSFKKGSSYSGMSVHRALFPQTSKSCKQYISQGLCISVYVSLVLALQVTHLT